MFGKASEKEVPMDHQDASEWKHTTTLDSRGHGDPVGVDLFDDEQTGFVSIYQRFTDGTRFPARTVNLSNAAHAEVVILAWMARGEVADYRQVKTPT